MMHSVISLSVAPNCVVYLMLTMRISLILCSHCNLLRSPHPPPASTPMPSAARLESCNVGLYMWINCSHRWFYRTCDEEQSYLSWAIEVNRPVSVATVYFPLQPPPLSYPNPIGGREPPCSTCEGPHFGSALNALQMSEWGWHRGHSFIMRKIETDRRAQGDFMWLLKGCGAGKK